MSKEISPLPWKAFTEDHFSGWWAIEDARGTEVGSGDGGYEEVDAAFIVKACNSHDILINALHAVVNGLEAVKKAGEKADGVGQLLNALDEAARAALAAAGTE